MYGKGFAFYFSIRFAKNMIQLPINIILTYYVLGFVKYIDKKIYNYLIGESSIKFSDGVECLLNKSLKEDGYV